MRDDSFHADEGLGEALFEISSATHQLILWSKPSATCDASLAIERSDDRRQASTHLKLGRALIKQSVYFRKRTRQSKPVWALIGAWHAICMWPWNLSSRRGASSSGAGSRNAGS